MQPPESKWLPAMIGDKALQPSAYQVEAAGATLSVHDVLLFGDKKAIVLFSVYGATDSQAVVESSGANDEAVYLIPPTAAHLGAPGKSNSEDVSTANAIVELARLGPVTLAAATFDMPKVSPRELAFSISEMTAITEGAPSKSYVGPWSITLLATDRPEEPDPNYIYQGFIVSPEGFSYGDIQVLRTDGLGRGGIRAGAWANSVHQVVDHGNLWVYKLQAPDKAEIIYAVTHQDGRTERISLETYEKWIEPTQGGYDEKYRPTPEGMPHATFTPVPPEVERALQATREWLEKQPVTPILEQIKQFPPEEQTPVPALNQPTATSP